MTTKRAKPTKSSPATAVLRRERAKRKELEGVVQSLQLALVDATTKLESHEVANQRAMAYAQGMREVFEEQMGRIETHLAALEDILRKFDPSVQEEVRELLRRMKDNTHG
jgi:flagellar biosynthesis/type III secretory pathway protein FliH